MPIYTSKETLQRRQKNRKAKKFAFLSLAILFILTISFAITSIINLFFVKEEETPSYFLETEATSSPETAIAGTPVLNPSPIVEPQTILSSNSNNLALMENGRVHLNYFDDALFLGDSLADGFYDYQSTTGIRAMAFFTNRSLQPISFINGNYVTVHGYDTSINAIETIKELSPKKIYIILGTNAMNLSDEQFLADYSALIDELKIAVPDCTIYINSLMPTTAEKSAEDSIYSPDRISNLNNSLAKIASQKSVYFLNIYEIFAVEGGHLNPDLAYSDGIHLTPTGYKNWSDYLISHTVYDENSPYVLGSPYIKP